MKRDEITHTQLTALIWAGVLAPAAELLPALTLPLAGRAAWLTPAWAIPLVLLAGWLLGGLAGSFCWPSGCGCAHRACCPQESGMDRCGFFWLL